MGELFGTLLFLVLLTAAALIVWELFVVLPATVIYKSWRGYARVRRALRGEQPLWKRREEKIP